MTRPSVLHPYQYASQSPVQKWDPDGRFDQAGFKLPSPQEMASILRKAEAATRPARSVAPVVTAASTSGAGLAAAIPASMPVAGALYLSWFGHAAHRLEQSAPAVLATATESPGTIQLGGVTTLRAHEAKLDPLYDLRSTLDRSSFSPFEFVNLDTGTAIALTQANIHPDTGAILAFIRGKTPLMCATAFSEFMSSLRFAGPQESIRATIVIGAVTIIPDMPSPTFESLHRTNAVGTNDKKIFGTGDSLSLTTMTGDDRFVRGAAAQGVVVDAFVHGPARLSGE